MPAPETDPGPGPATADRGGPVGREPSFAELSRLAGEAGAQAERWVAASLDAVGAQARRGAMLWQFVTGIRQALALAAAAGLVLVSLGLGEWLAGAWGAGPAMGRLLAGILLLALLALALWSLQAFLERRGALRALARREERARALASRPEVGSRRPPRENGHVHG